MTKQTAIPTTPFPLALILCDNAITDESSKKTTLVGIFDRILVEKFPAKHRPLTIYARLTDAEGSYDFRTDYVQAKTDKLLAKVMISGVKVHNRLSTFEIIVTPPLILIPEPGQYEFRLWANNHYVGRVGFAAEKLPKKGEQS